MSDGIESKSDKLSSKNRISVIAFRKQPNKKNSVKPQQEVVKVSKTNSEAEVNMAKIKTENPNENLVKLANETEIEEKIEKVVESDKKFLQEQNHQKSQSRNHQTLFP